MVTSDPIGFRSYSAASSGMSGTASAYSRRKRSRAARPSGTAANEASSFPGTGSYGQNSVHVKLPSGFGRAIIMLPPRGQMWSAFGSIANGAWGPAATGGIESSLYPCASECCE